MDTLINFNKIRNALILCLLFFTVIILLPSGGFTSDINLWLHWSDVTTQHGIGYIYNYSASDYLPVYHYLLWFYGSLNGSYALIEAHSDYLKLFTFIFDLSIFGFLLYYLQQQQIRFIKSLALSLCYILNIAILYNGLIWGQVDTIQCALILFCCFAAYKRNIVGSIIFMTIALFFKLQVIIFLPFIAVFLLPAIVAQCSFKNIVKWLFTFFITATLICLPFILAGTLDKVWHVVTGSFSKFPVLTLYALNHWYWYYDDPTYVHDDILVANFISLKQIGLLLFSCSFFTLLFLLLSLSIKLYNKGITNKLLSLPNMMLLLSLVNFCFYFLNTEMHERYIHPTLVFFAVYVIITRSNFIAYIILSAVVFLNMELVLRYFKMHYHTFIFIPAFLATIYFLIMCYIAYLWFKAYRLAMQDYKMIKVI